MQIINRNLFIAKPKQPYVDWINVQPDQEPPVSLAYIQRDCHIYLIPEMVNEEEALEYIQAFKLSGITEKLMGYTGRYDSTHPGKRT